MWISPITFSFFFLNPWVFILIILFNVWYFRIFLFYLYDEYFLFAVGIFFYWVYNFLILSCFHFSPLFTLMFGSFKFTTEFAFLLLLVSLHHVFALDSSLMRLVVIFIIFFHHHVVYFCQTLSELVHYS